MIDALIGGKIYGKPTSRVGNSGKQFVVAKVRAAVGDGDAMLVNVITFSDTVGKALLALDEGDSVSLSGALTPKVWTPPGGEPRPVLDMVAQAVTTAYHVTRKRQAVSEAVSEAVRASKAPTQRARKAAESFFNTKKPPQADFADDLPWAEA